REEARPGEAVVIQADDGLDELLGLSNTVGSLARLPPFAVRAAVQQDLGGALRLGGPGDPISIAADLELQGHRHPRLALADELADPVADPFDPPVERVG